MSDSFIYLLIFGAIVQLVFESLVLSLVIAALTAFTVKIILPKYRMSATMTIISSILISEFATFFPLLKNLISLNLQKEVFYNIFIFFIYGLFQAIFVRVILVGFARRKNQSDFVREFHMLQWLHGF